jgi:hypothetical protein
MSIRYLSGINVDSNVLFVDSANDRVGIGTGSPTYTLDVVGSIRSTGNEGKVIINSTAVSGKQYEFISIDTGNLGLYDGTSYRLWVSGAGNVGIGTTAPASKLEVRGTVTFFGDSNFQAGNLVLVDVTSGGSTWGIYSGFPSLGDFTIRESGIANRLVIKKTTGNVGIGTDSPSALLHVSQASANTVVRIGNNTTYDQFIYFNGSNDWSLGMDYSNSNAFVLSNASSIGTNDRVVVTTGGNVGIGTTSPQSRLDLSPPASQSTTSTLGYSANAQLNIRIPNSVGDVGQIVFTNDSAPTAGYASIGVVMTSGTGVGIGDIIMSTKSIGADAASTERMRITSGGNVGIGTTAPDAKLDVRMSGSNGTFGRGRAGNLNLQNTNTSVTQGGWLSISGYMGNSVANYEMGMITGGKDTSAGDNNYAGHLSFWTCSGGANGEANSGSYERVRINGSGNVGIGTTAPSERLVVNAASGSNAIIYAATDTGQSGLKLLAGTGATNRATRVDFLNGVSSGTVPRWTLINDYNQNGTNDFRFVNSDQLTSVLTLLQGGNVGIGTTAPVDQLAIGASSSVAGFSVGSGLTQVFLRYNNYFNVSNQVSDAAKGSASIGIGRSSDGVVTFWTAAAGAGAPVERMRITSTGNVGIGTTSPAQKLEVSGSAAGDFAALSLSNTNQSGTADGLTVNFKLGRTVDSFLFTIPAIKFVKEQQWTSTPATVDGALLFSTILDESVNERMRINSAGNVGIGNSSPQANGASAVLDVGNGSGGTLNLRDTNTGIAAEGFNQIFGGDNRMYLYAGGSGASSYMQFYTNDVERMRIHTNGNFGVGTTNPIQPLTVSAVANANTIALLGRAADNASRIDFYNNAGNSRLYTVALGNSAVEHYADANIPMVFSTNAAERLRITAAGSVGIGTTSPTSLLSVQGNTDLGNSYGNTTSSTYTTRISGFALYQDASNRYGNYGVLILNSDSGWTGSARRFMITNGLGSNKFAIIRSVDANTDPALGTAGSVASGTVDFEINNAGAATFASSVTASSFIGPLTGNASTATNVAWSGVSSGYRENYDLGFRPADNSSSYSGFKFGTPSFDANAGYLLIRGGADTDVYTQNGITLVADAGWLTLAQRTQSDKGIRFMTGATSTTKMVILNGGNVGIGTTAPQKPLEVVSNANDFVSVGVAQIGVGQWTGIHFGYREGNTFYRKSAIVFERTDLTANDAQGKIHILNGPQNNSGSASLSDAKITIAENGNVGIGTTGPSGKFEVGGGSGSTGVQSYFSTGAGYTDPAAGSAAFPGGAKIILWNDTSTPQKASIGMDGSADIWFNNAGGQAGAGFTFYTGDGASATPSARLKITKSGDVGIGTTSPGYKLDVSNAARVYGVRMGRDFSIANRATVRLDSNGDAPADILFGQTAAANQTGWDGVYWSISSRNSGAGAPEGNKFTIWRGSAHGSPNNSENQFVTITPDLNFGIGTTSPGYKLDVVASSNGTYPFIVRNAGNAEIGGIYSTSGGAGQIYLFNASTVSTVKISTIDDSYFNGGNVGIGTTAPGQKVDVVGASATDTYLRVLGGAGATKGGIIIGNNDSGKNYGSLFFDNSNNNVYLYQQYSSGDLILGTNTNEKMRITSAGNVGIGTASPLVRLHVVGSTFVDNGFLYMTDGFPIVWGANTSIEGNAGDVNIRTDASIRVKVKATTGNVGINTTAPQQLLHVLGATNGYAMIQGANDAGQAGIYFKKEDTTGTMDRTKGLIVFHTNVGSGWGRGHLGFCLNSADSNAIVSVSDEKFRMVDNGDFLADGDVVAYSTTISDARYKTNIQPIESALDKVNQMRGVSFDWKAVRSGREFGVIAQEIEQIAPEVVSEKELLNGETMKTVSYTSLVPFLIESIKELTAKVAELESKLNQK